MHDMSDTYVNHKPTYFKIFLALAVLTGIEVAIPFIAHAQPDPHVALGLTWSRTALLALASAKASLVGLYFMHLKWETRWVRLVALAPACLVFFAVFLIAEQIYRLS